MAEPVFIFWADDEKHIRLWTKDRQRALQFAIDSGAEAQVYVPADKVTEAWQEATRQAMEKCAEVCESEVERLKADAKKTPLLSNMCHTLMVEALACAAAIRSLLPNEEKRHG